MHDSANVQRCSIDRLLQWEFWATVSRWGLLGKPRPTTQANSGPRFPDGASRGNCVPLRSVKTECAFRLRSLTETATRNWRPDWDSISRSSSSGKLRPGICARNGTWFPRGPKQPPASLDKMIRFPSSHAKQPRSVPGCRHNRNVPSCRQHFAATAKARAGNKCHLRGLGGRSQRHVTEAHVSYGLPNSTDTRCPPAYQTMKLAIVLDNRRNAGKVQIQRDDRHDNDHCCDQFVVQMRKHLLAAPALAHNVDGNGRGK